MSRPGWCLVLCLAMMSCFAMGCGDEEESAGTPPTISAMTYDPSTVPVGQPATVTGSFQFADTEGDISGMKASITLPDGSSQDIPAQNPDAAGKNEGTIMFGLGLALPAAGNYTFHIWVVDKGGNESNHLSGDIVAE